MVPFFFLHHLFMYSRIKFYSRIKLKKPVTGKKNLIDKMPSLLIFSPRNIFLNEARRKGDGGIGYFAKFSGKERRSFSPPAREESETVKFSNSSFKRTRQRRHEFKNLKSNHESNLQLNK